MFSCSLRLNGDTVAMGERSGRLYAMKIKVISVGAIQSNAMAVCTLREWHEKLAHQNIKRVKDFLRSNKITFSNNINSEFFCKDCVFGKQHRSSFKSSVKKTLATGDLIVSDVCAVQCKWRQ